MAGGAGVDQPSEKMAYGGHLTKKYPLTPTAVGKHKRVGVPNQILKLGLKRRGVVRALFSCLMIRRGHKGCSPYLRSDPISRGLVKGKKKSKSPRSTSPPIPGRRPPVY